ncbi:MAG: hypothetical protein NT031_00155 [Planctomycetota bacterium]|nr:hypothetical protein [Planctomycetota bacterium]
METGVDVAFHEHRATFAQADGGLARQRHPGELALDGDVQFVRPFLEEAARAGGAGLVHREVHHDAVLERDVLGVLPADLEDRVGQPSVQHRPGDEGRAGLVGGDFVVDGIGPDELADQFAPRARRAHPADDHAVAQLIPDRPQGLGNDLDGPALSHRVDLVDHPPLLVDQHDVRRDAADVHAQIRLDGRAVVAEAVGLGVVAKEHDVVHGKRGRRGERTGGGVAGGPKGLQARQARALGADGDGRSDRRHVREVLRDEQLRFVQGEDLPQRRPHGGIGGQPAHERHRRFHRVAPHDRQAEVPRHRRAQAPKNLARAVALLLGVDHVALGEHAAPPGDLGGAGSGQGDCAHLLALIEQPAGLLVDERTRARRAVAIGGVVDDAVALTGLAGEPDVLRGLPAHLEHRTDRDAQGREALGEGLEFVDLPGPEQFGDQLGARAGQADAFDGVLSDGGEDLLDELPRRGQGLATGPPILAEIDRSPVACRSRRRERPALNAPPGLDKQGRLRTDGSNVDSYCTTH